MFKRMMVCTVITITSLTAGWVSFDGTSTPTPPSITILQNDDQAVVLNIKIPGILSEDRIVDGVAFQRIWFPQEFSMYEIGKPALPTIRRFIQIPSQSRTVLNTEIIFDTLLSNFNVFPYQQPYWHPDSIPAFTVDNLTYSSDMWYPNETATKSPPAILSNLRVITLCINPISFDPVQKKINVKRELNIKIAFDGIDTFNATSESPPIKSRKLDALYRSIVLNYVHQLDTVIPEGGLRDEPDEYLVLVPDKYYNATSDLMFWRSKTGSNVMVYKLSQIPGYTGSPSDTNDIRNFIASHITPSTSNNVLLIGNETKIPFFNGWFQPPPYGGDVTPSDHYYACVVGNDEIPDIIVARLYVNSKTDIQTFTDKIFDYERYYDPNWNSCPVKLYYAQMCPEGYDAKHLIWTNFQTGNPYSIITQLTNDPNLVAQPVNAGLGMINYLGHGNHNKWVSAFGDEYWTVDNIHSLLSNQSKYPIVFNMCCHNAGFQISTETMAEAWTLTPNKGAVAAVGATEKCWGGALPPNDILCRFDTTLWKWCRDYWGYPYLWWSCTIGYALYRAKMLMCLMGDIYAVTNARTYLLDGDPELYKWNFTGFVTCCTHPTQLTTGLNTITVHVGSPWGTDIFAAKVCLYKPNDVLDVSYTDTDGNTTRTVNLNTTGALYVTARGQWHWPYEGTISVSYAATDRDQ